MKNEKTYSKRALTDYLRKVAVETVSVDDDGNPITNAEKLARVIWDKANGYIEQQFKNGETVEKHHPPAAWAIQLLLDRLEGRVAAVAEDESTRIKAADRVGEVAANYINKLTEETVGPPPISKEPDGE